MSIDGVTILFFFGQLEIPTSFLPSKMASLPQPIGPDGTCVTKLSFINFARPSMHHRLAANATVEVTNQALTLFFSTLK